MTATFAAKPLATFETLPAMEQTSAREWLISRARAEAAPAFVTLHAPSFAFQTPGGGENQLIQTARHLEALGVDLRLFSSWTDRLAESKILHLFGMSQEGLELARIARKQGVKVVLSPICWLEPGALFALANSRARGAWHAAKWSLKGIIPRIRGWRDELIALSDAILPNSHSEAAQLQRFFRADPTRIHVVPNGVDPRFAKADAGLFANPSDEDFILYVGRIEPRKNVLALIHAAKAIKKPLVIIGAAPSREADYLARCRSAGQGFTTWIDAFEHDDPRLAAAYAAARVFALPSWFETPGLAALEAALAGTAVVLTPHGCTREYFGDRVEYARPDRPQEIIDALERAWHDGPRPGLRSLVAEHYPWTVVAKRTAEAYEHVMR